MKYDVINILNKGAAALAREDDGGTAYALWEAANNLRLVMRGDASLADWNDTYVGANREPIDIDEAFKANPPRRSDEDEQAEAA